MYSELIYTRCGYGLDIDKNFAKIDGGSVGGFMVYTCTRNITEDGMADRRFLQTLRAEKQSYSDPDFMENAYSYITPDIGKPILVNFLPRRFDINAEGNYTHRPGNFINHFIIGDFEDLYPWSTFGCREIWSAEALPERYYYETPSEVLEPRAELPLVGGSIRYNDITAFIADGRKNVYMKAVSYIIEQYALPPEKRKYMVILDKDRRSLELWIAAIECAFSPRMASGLSFSTRLDRFDMNNTYSVDSNGRYQETMDFSNTSLKLRTRAMLVGVDKRDKDNVNRVRKDGSVKYAVLNGEELTMTEEPDISAPYFEFIADFSNPKRTDFINFLQMTDIRYPSSDIHNLYKAFGIYEKFLYTKSIDDLLRALDIIGRYPIITNAYFRDIHAFILSCFSHFLQQDAIKAFRVVDWLNNHADNSNAVSNEINEMVYRVYTELVFTSPKKKSTAQLHKFIKSSNYAERAGRCILDKASFEQYRETLEQYTDSDWVAFLQLYISWLPSNAFPETAPTVFAHTLTALYQAKRFPEATPFLNEVAQRYPQDIKEMLFTMAERSKTEHFAGFLIMLYLEVFPDGKSSTIGVRRFCSLLEEHHLKNLRKVALRAGADYITKNLSAGEAEAYFVWVTGNQHDEFKDMDLTAVFSRLDDAVFPVRDASSYSLARRIVQESEKNTDIVCPKSAHVLLVSYLKSKKNYNPKKVYALIEMLGKKGCFSIEDEEGAGILVDQMFKSFPDRAIANTVSATASSVFYANRIVAVAFSRINTNTFFATGKHKSDDKARIQRIVMTAACYNSRAYAEAIIQALKKSGNSPKYIGYLYGIMPNDARINRYLAAIKAAL